MGDTFFIPFEYCQRWAIRLDRFDDGQRAVTHAWSWAVICMHKETSLLWEKRGANFAQVFLSAADTSGVTTRKAACRPALRPDVKAQPRW